jgi:hypothetical protein
MHHYDDLLNDSLNEYAFGGDDRYIANLLLDRGVDEETINRILREVKKQRNTDKRRAGLKWMIGGASLILVGILFTWISSSKDSPVLFILYGAVFAGAISFMKGLIKFVFLW